VRCLVAILGDLTKDDVLAAALDDLEELAVGLFVTPTRREDVADIETVGGGA